MKRKPSRISRFLFIPVALFLNVFPVKADEEDYRKKLEQIGKVFTVNEFFISVWEGKTEEVKLYLDGGMDVKASDDLGVTALMYAATRGNEEIGRLLISRGAEPNTRDSRGYTALMMAAVRGHTEFIKLLLRNGADPGKEDNYGLTALYWAARENMIESVKILLENGASPRGRNEYGEPLLIEAIVYGQTDIVKLLLSHGADPEVKDQFGTPALVLAAQMENREMVESLLKASASSSKLASEIMNWLDEGTSTKTTLPMLEDEEFFQVHIRQNGKILKREHHTVKLTKSPFDVVFILKKPMAVFMQVSFDPSLGEGLRSGKNLKELLGVSSPFSGMGIAEYNFNPEEQVFVGDEGAHYLFYYGDEEHRFSRVEKKNGYIYAQRKIAFYKTELQDRKVPMFRIDRDAIYLIFYYGENGAWQTDYLRLDFPKRK